jgi:hypothetical protein
MAWESTDDAYPYRIDMAALCEYSSRIPELVFGRWGENCNLADSYCPAFHIGDQVLHLLNNRVRESSANSHEQLLPGNFLFPT